MSFIFNSNTLDKAVFNGSEAEKVIFNGVEVFSAYNPHFPAAPDDSLIEIFTDVFSGFDVNASSQIRAHYLRQGFDFHGPYVDMFGDPNTFSGFNNVISKSFDTIGGSSYSNCALEFDDTLGIRIGNVDDLGAISQWSDWLEFDKDGNGFGEFTQPIRYTTDATHQNGIYGYTILSVNTHTIQFRSEFGGARAGGSITFVLK
jgi:hypothetical protein